MIADFEMTLILGTWKPERCSREKSKANCPLCHQSGKIAA